MKAQIIATFLISALPNVYGRDFVRSGSALSSPEKVTLWDMGITDMCDRQERQAAPRYIWYSDGEISEIIDGRRLRYMSDSVGVRWITEETTLMRLTLQSPVYTSGFSGDDDMDTTLMRARILEAVTLPTGYMYNARGGMFFMNCWGIIDVMSYPYGEPLEQPQVENRFLYGGKEYLDADGRNEYFYEARYLVPSLCIMTSPDPMRHKYPWLSQYIFCNANPINYTDPTGMDFNYVIDESTIRITVNIAFYGDNEKDKVDILKNGIIKEWSGVDTQIKWPVVIDQNKTYNVTFDVNITTADSKSEAESRQISVDSKDHLNIIELKEGEFRSYVDLSGNTGTWRTTGRKGRSLKDDNPGPHEFGHLLGLDDLYKETENGICSKDGQDWSGDIMFESAGNGKVSCSNVTRIILRIIENDNYEKFGVVKVNNDFK